MLPKVIIPLRGNLVFFGFILPFSLGLLTALGHPPIGTLIISILAFGFFTISWLNLASTPARFYSGLSYALGYFVLSLHWVGINYLAGENPEIFKAGFSVVLITVYSSLFWAAAFLAVSSLPVRYFDRAWLLGLSIPVADLARATVGQSPIALFGGMWTVTPLVHFASAGSAFLIALSACLPVSLIVGKKHMSAMVVIALFSAYLHFLGPDPVRFSDVRVAIVQHNAEQSLKWTDGYDSVLENRLFSMARAAQAHNADIIIAPENAITRLMHDEDPFFERLINHDMPPVLFGAPANNSTGQLSNSAFLASGNLEQPAKYNKVHLAPVAEMDIWPFSKDNLALTPGVSQSVFELPDHLPSIAPLICFDAFFAVRGADFSSRPGLLAVITSESLIGEYGSYQALNNSIIRAVESGLPVVRTSTTGASSLIAPDGSVLIKTKFDLRELRISKLPLPFEPTLFWEYGRLLNFFVILIVLFASSLPLLSHKTSRFCQ